MKGNEGMESSGWVVMGGVDTQQEIQVRHAFETRRRQVVTLRAVETKRALTLPLGLNHEETNKRILQLERDAVSLEKVRFQLRLVSERTVRRVI